MRYRSSPFEVKCKLRSFGAFRVGFSMKLSTKGRYAVTAMADIALQQGGQPVALGDIAERQKISLAYLEQLFGKLRRAGLVVSMRGPGGGYSLARPAADIAVSQIMAAVEEKLQATQCTGEVGEGCSVAGTRCLTHNLWESLSAHVHVFLQQTSLEDVIATPMTPCPAVPDFIGMTNFMGEGARD